MPDKNDELYNIAKYCGRESKYKEGYKCLCPLHNDKNPSLLLNLSHNGNIVATCLAGCNWKDLLNHFKDKGLMHSDINIDSRSQNHNQPKDTIVDTYYYTDSIGDVLFEKQRLEPELMLGQGIKRFLYRRKPKSTNKYLYKDVIKTLPSETKIPLYNLPEIFKANTVYICEGEKDVKELIKHLPDGNTATCNHDGAGKWLPHYNTWLKGKTCIILQDNDESGEKHTALLTDNLADICKLHLVTFKQYKDVTFPRKYDASDFIKDYGWHELEHYITQNMQLVTSKKKVKEIEKDSKEDVKKIPRATFDDYVALIKRTLGTYGKDIFSNKVLTLSDGIWQSAIDLIPIIRSEAAIEEELGLRRYNRPLIEDHFNKWAASLTPRFLIDIPEWDGIDRIRIFSDALNISHNQDFNQNDVDQLLSDWICKAYQRLHDPNIRNRIIILKGGQEIGKDTWIDSLLFGAGQFANTVTTMQHDKDAFLQLSKGMFLKISEFDKTGRTEVSMIKELITIPSTDLRASYDRDFKRRYSRTSFIAACNVDDILRDSTGSTRYIIFEVDSLKRKSDGWHFDFPVRSQHDGLQVLSQARHLASINFRASSETEAKLKAYLDNKTPDDPNLDILEAYEELVTQRLKELPLIEQLELKSRGWIDNKHAMKIVREIAERCEMKDRTVRIKLKGLGLGIKSGNNRGFKIIDSTCSKVDKVSENLTEEEIHF